MIFSRFLNWFYCLPPQTALMLSGLFLLGLRILHERFAGKRLWRVLLALMLASGVFLVLSSTLLGRTPGTKYYFAPLFDSYRPASRLLNPELLRSNFMNLLLFLPLGFLAALLLDRLPRLRLLLVPLCLTLLSLLIEWCQAAYGLGIPEWDDVYHNGLGAMLGALGTLPKLKNKTC